MAKRAFTLIELLIVVLIISILASIAVPNYLEFTTRAKVARAMADMRTCATAIEAYAVINGPYVPCGVDWLGALSPDTNRDWGYMLTTPISLISRWPVDIFAEKGAIRPGVRPNRSFSYYTVQYYRQTSQFSDWDWVHHDYCVYHTIVAPDDFAHDYITQGGAVQWELISVGPNLINDNAVQYDPTNGTVSAGDVCRFGP